MPEEIAEDLLVQIIIRPELILYVGPDRGLFHEPWYLIDYIRYR